ncbi:MAG TPA: hypothetical protein VFU89_02885 [Rhabdochlamydiaceae bacterium]|nr:hypothetical protein [Rhabdochlamydiaceae bacterium]
MLFLLTACAAPVTNITGPLYRICRGNEDAYNETKKLMFALLRTVTVVAFLFADIPFGYIFGGYNDLSAQLAFAARFLIHPYAAALHNSFIHGGPLLIEKVTALFMKQPLSLTPDDVGNLVVATAFCYIAELIDQPQNRYFLDQIYTTLSRATATMIYPRHQQRKKNLLDD